MDAQRGPAVKPWVQGWAYSASPNSRINGTCRLSVFRRAAIAFQCRVRRLMKYCRPVNKAVRAGARISEAVAALAAASTTIDGEAVWCDPDGLAIFEKLHSRAHDGEVLL
jgi:hypothetical protein